MSRQRIIAWAAAVAMATCATGLFAVTATQSYTLTVDPILTITPPSADTETKSATDVNHAFAGSKRWEIAQNQVRGSSVTFAAPAFSMTNGATTVKRNTRLGLALVAAGSGSETETAAGWSIVTATSDSTIPVLGTDASVSALSTAAGNGSFDLTVTFLDTDHSTLAHGS